MTVLNQGDAQSFFRSETVSPTGTDLISSQVDPSQPQVDGLTSVSDPIVADQRVLDRLGHFDPTLFDLRDSSHLMRLLQALLGASGLGGLRKQALLRRLEAGSLGATDFLALDRFWGSIFGLTRMLDESLDGDPASQVADQDSWDDVAGRDGKFRSRLMQFARAVNQGATYYGLMAAAEAVLGCEVELIEGWTIADQIPPGSIPSAINGNTFLAVRSKYGTYGNMKGIPYGVIEGGQSSPGQVPLGNRGEVVIQPRRGITQEEKWHLDRALELLRPAGVSITIRDSGQETQQLIAARSTWADSEHWDVVSLITPRSDLAFIGDDLYPPGGSYENGRPAYSAYQGESWSYNGQIAAVSSYRMDVTGAIVDSTDYQTITYLDGQRHTYVPTDGVMTDYQASAARAASEGVMTTYPISVAS